MAYIPLVTCLFLPLAEELVKLASFTFKPFRDALRLAQSSPVMNSTIAHSRFHSFRRLTYARLTSACVETLSRR